MILIHISYFGNKPVLWAERSSDEQTVTRKRTTSAAKLRTYPYDAGKDGLKLLHQTLDDVSVKICREKTAAWLPTAGKKPLPSSTLIDSGANSKAKPQIKPWSVTIGEVSMKDLVNILILCDNNRTLAPGIVVGKDVLFLRNVMRFAGSLVAHQHFLPGVHSSGKSFQAQWQPVIIGGDKERFAYLLKTMPAVIYALTDTKRKTPPTKSREIVLLEILTGFVDSFIRFSTSDYHESYRDETIHDRWLRALQTKEGKLAGNKKELTDLVQQIADWRRVLDRLSDSPYRLCFRLHEPAPDNRAKKKDEKWHVEYLLQRHDDRSLLIPVKDLWNGSNDSLPEQLNNSAREYLLMALGQASGLSQHIEESLKKPSPAGFRLNTSGSYEFLTRTAATLEQAGFGVFLPAWWTRKGTKQRLTARVEVKSPKMKAKGVLGMDNITAFNWKVALGDEELTPEELERLARLKTPLVKIRGQWVDLDAHEIHKAVNFLNKQRTNKTTLREIIRMKLGASDSLHGLDVSEVTATGWMNDILRHLEDGGTFEELPPPKKFSGTLRPYQIRGYSWLNYLQSRGFGACLADDMGLGKTIQTLALIQRNWIAGDRKPVLLICPTTIIHNWVKEASRFTPDLPVMIHHGIDRKKGKKFKDNANKHAIVVSSYALLHRDREHLQEINWGGIVLDEAQNIKNPDTKQSRAARELKAGYRIVLTGTPVENHVGDLWSIMEFLNPGFLGTQTEFKRRFFIPIQTGTDPNAPEQLQRITRPFILRRVKTDKSIISDLPEKMEMKVYCSLTKEQVSLYESVLKDVEDQLNSSEGIERKGIILATLSKLKQVCNHPAQFLGDNSIITDRSGKLQRLTEMMEEILEVGDKALVFTQFAEMGGILKKHLQETFGREIPFLYGATPRKERERMVELFQNGHNAAPVFILSLKAGGTGLNLTQANHVFHFDRWWNPAVENQATDRAFRIGQMRNVQVHKFICSGTLEDKIDEMIERKKEIAGKVVGTGEGWLTELSNEELKELFILRKVE